LKEPKAIERFRFEVTFFEGEMFFGKQSFSSFRAQAAKNAAWVFLGSALIFIGIRFVEFRQIEIWPDVWFVVIERIFEVVVFFGLYFRYRSVFIFAIFFTVVLLYALAVEIFADVGAVQLKNFFVVLQLFFLVVLVEGLRHLNREVKLRVRDTSMRTGELSE